MYKMLFFVLLLVFSANGLTNADDSISKSTVSINKRTIACPSKSFANFFEVFTENIEIQKEFIKYPLKDITIYGMEGEPDYNEYVLIQERHQIEFPIMPNKKERKLEHMRYSIDKLTSKQARVILNKDDSGVSVSYYFEKDACWRLTSIRDYSM